MIFARAFSRRSFVPRARNLPVNLAELSSQTRVILDISSRLLFYDVAEFGAKSSFLEGYLLSVRSFQHTSQTKLWKRHTPFGSSNRRFSSRHVTDKL